MERARKKLTAALDGLRNNFQNTITISTDENFEVSERLSPENICFSRLVRHGFPHDPQCLAFDPVQKLCAIGAARGCVRILGQAGVDHHLKHNSEEPVTHVLFLVNEGGLITTLNNDSIHLWNFRQKTPEIVHSLQLNKERISILHLPLHSRWLYVGTDKGNVYVVCLATFKLSSYVINWNKAHTLALTSKGVDPNTKIHPGAVRLLSISPSEPSRLLIVFKKGGVVMWNLLTREPERLVPTETPPVTALCWHYDGRQFMCGHSDGSLTIWNLKKPNEVVNRTTPHSPSDSTIQCKSITHLIWSTNANNEQLIIFAGGMPQDEGALPSLTILRAKGSLTVLEMDYSIVEVLPLLTSPYPTIAQHPHALVVLLKNDFLIVDLTAQGYPCFESPYPMDIHEHPVTCLHYFADCPGDCIAALTLVGRNQRRQGVRQSDRNWPISGGISREYATGNQEILLTGHEDGSLKFWHASGEQLQLMYKLKTGRHFEKNNANAMNLSMEGEDQNDRPSLASISHAVTHLEFCLDSRILVVANASGQITLFRFAKTEGCQEIAVIYLPQLSHLNISSTSEETPPVFERSQQQNDTTKRENAPSQSSHSTDTSLLSQLAEHTPLKVRGGALRRPAGYQPEFVCQIPWRSYGQPEQIAAIALNSQIGMLAVSTSVGLALIDIQNVVLICAWSNVELYTKDPTMSVSTKQHSPSNNIAAEKSPSSDQPGAVSSPSTIKNHLKLSMLHSKVPHIPRINTTDSTSQQRPPLNKALTVNPNVTIPQESDDLPASNAQTHENNGGEEKNDTNLSRSSSSSSLEKVFQNDFITSLTFINVGILKNDSSPGYEPMLWIGTFSGTCMAMQLNLSTSVNTIQTSNSGLGGASNTSLLGMLVRLQGQILHIAFMDRNFCLIEAQSETYRDIGDSIPPSKEQKEIENKIMTKATLAPSFSNSKDEEKIKTPLEHLSSELVILVSEKDAQVITISGFNRLFSYQFDPIPIVKAKTSHIKGSPALVCLTGAGAVQVLTLPTMKFLSQISIFSFSIEVDDPICQRFAVSEMGLGVFMTSPSEIVKFTLDAELAVQIMNCSGELFVPCDMPEPPKSSFFREVSSLFTTGISGRPESIDFDALFGEDKSPTSSANTMMKMIARPISSSAQPYTIVNSTERAEEGSISAGEALRIAMQNLGERSERLDAVTDATEQLRNNAQNLQSKAAKLAQKYEKKRWYQF